ncbi:MAG: hypothetical protein KatS3mg129_0711 [Leptospiraceae bacterium]|nr:MAG: hypothetical protein KatS3mg129_0711 [Leptospiraceae bacterium]
MKIDINEIIEKYKIFDLDERLRFADWFYNYYRNYSAQDIYTWLWIGEFGYPEFPQVSLNLLRENIRKAKLQPSKIRKIWEPIGISKKFIKINIDLYFEAGYPLLRLIDLIEKVKEFKNIDKLTFKNNWNLMKIQLDFTKPLTLKDLNQFQEKIPFHMTPFYPFTEEFLKEFGQYYFIVPMDMFFNFYPECIDDYPELFIYPEEDYLELIDENI